MDRPLRVLAVARATPSIRLFELGYDDGSDLPAFTPGAHVVLHLECGLARQYSLCGDLLDGKRYRIAVHLEEEGRGGSRFIHESVGPGSCFPQWSLANSFTFDESAPRYRFLAGGVGITPLMPMLARAAALGRPFTLDYCTRSPEDTLFRHEVAALAAPGAVRFHFSRVAGGGRWNVQRELGERAEGELLYCCGPAGLTRDVRAATAAWPAGAVRFEVFHAEANGVDAAAERSFTVEIASTGARLAVAADTSILHALRAHGIEVPSSCEAGACGTCQTRYLSGEPDHRDLYLTDDERREYLMVCVSRARSDCLVLDL